MVQTHSQEGECLGQAVINAMVEKGSRPRCWDTQWVGCGWRQGSQGWPVRATRWPGTTGALGMGNQVMVTRAQ